MNFSIFPQSPPLIHEFVPLKRVDLAAVQVLSDLGQLPDGLGVFLSVEVG